MGLTAGIGRVCSSNLHSVKFMVWWPSWRQIEYLDVWRMFESFSMKQNPKQHFWRLGLSKYMKITIQKGWLRLLLDFHTLSLSLSLSLNPLYVFVFVLAPWFIIYGYLPVSNWPAVESCWWYWWFHYQSVPQCWTVLRRQRKIRPIYSFCEGTFQSVQSAICSEH